MKFILILFISIISFSIVAQTPLKEIKLGTQTWVVTNLNTSKFVNGEIIPQAKTAAERKNCVRRGGGCTECLGIANCER